MSKLGDDIDFAGEDAAPGAPEPAAFPRRRQRGAALPDELGDVGDRLVGSPKESVAALQKRKSMQQVYLVLVVVCVLGGVGGVYYLSTKTGGNDKGAVSTGREARQASGVGVVATGPDPVETVMDTTQEPVPIEVEAAPTPSAVPSAIPQGAPATSPPAIPGPSTAPPSADSRNAAAPRPGAMDLLPPPMPTSNRGQADVPALGDPTASGLAPVLAPARGRPMGERLEKLAGFGKAAGSADADGVAARYAVRRSPIAPAESRPSERAGLEVADGASATNGKGSADPGGACYRGRLVPGTRVVATAAVGSPAAVSGEPLEATLDAPLLMNGVELLPAGTTAYGIGRAFDDGTGNPRLVVDFTTYKRPDNSVCTLPGVTYSLEDRRVGLRVPINHQWAAKGRRVGIAGGLAALAAKVAGQGKDAVQGGIAGAVGVESAENAAKKTAYGDALAIIKQESNLNKPTTGALLTLPEGQQFWIVYGMPGTGGGR